jgi:hypothetical protein
MNRHRTNIGAAALVAAVLVVLSIHPSGATVIDFNGLAAGTVLAGESPSGGAVSEKPFADFTLSCINTGGGPNSLLLFDSQNPTGGDDDLGTPNVDFDGPGVGWGGSSGRPGENDTSWGNLVIVAENLKDCDDDGLVDDPDDEAGGGVIIFEFERAVVVLRIVLVDIDYDESAEVRLYDESGLAATLSAQALGNNSVQTLDGGAQLGIHRMEIELSSSGAVAEVEYVLDTTPVAHRTWGAIKAAYSR